MHLLYARFFTKALRDLGIIDFGEPFLRLFNQGIILGEDHEKMSKSRGNVVNPDDVVAAYGADAVRAFLMFIGPWDQGGAWSPTGIQGMSRWLNRVWALAARDATDLPASAANGDGLERLRHKTIRKVTNDLDRFQFNTALAALMEYSNELQRVWDAGAADAEAWRQAIETLIILLAPTCPHIAEELWALAGRDYSIHNQPWPSWDEAIAADTEITLVVQVNGKMRDKLTVEAGIAEEAAKDLAFASERAAAHVGGKTVRKVIYVPGKLVNIVVG